MFRAKRCVSGHDMALDGRERTKINGGCSTETRITLIWMSEYDYDACTLF